MTTDETIPMTSGFEIMTKARAVREVAIEMEIHHVYKGTENYALPEFVGAIESSFSEILPAFEQFVGPGAAIQESLTDSIIQLRNQLTDPVLEDIGYAEIQLSGWNGPRDGAADTFRKDFLGRLPGYLRNQLLLVNELDGALRAANNIAAASQQDLLQIADKAIVALELTSFGTSGSGASPIDLELKVLGVTASAAATLISGSWPVVALSLAGQVATLAIAPKDVSAPAGPTPRSVVGSMMLAIDKLVENTHAKDQALAELLQIDRENVEAVRGTHLEPSFANNSCP